MRFLANGPSIPGELLVARDEGRVVFFCGAGVSRARAGLLDFFGLAKNVIDTLGVTAEDPARRIVEEAQEFDRRTGTSGLISADRIFGLLERDFNSRYIEEAVAKALKPILDVDLSAHRILLDLARTPDGKVRLVTTNFDLLFESCDSSLKSLSPPRLPDPLRYEEFAGIIHLHGNVDKNYEGAAGDGFVLSSSGFGRAYLSEGWATSFIKSVLEKYVVVFVGYTADDPPVQYLLEALNSYHGSLEDVYASQEGSSGQAEAKWRQKGAQPIAYDEADDHIALWNTLEAWTKRAKDPDRWYENVLDMARKGPEMLSPHERGQVAHIISTFEWVRKFSGSEDPPPAEWLCVFDPSIRYSKPGYLGNFHEKGPYFDPFSAYGIDDDLPPIKIAPDDLFAKREIPESVWNCFEATKLDHQNLQDHNFPAVRGLWAVNVSQLPVRLLELCVWIGRVSNQPAAVWWASTQTALHPFLQNRIFLELERTPKVCVPEIRKAWHYIFEAWKTPPKDFHYDWFQLKASIDLDGWSNAAIREFAQMNKPLLIVKKPFLGGPKPPGTNPDIHLEEMVDLDVKYPASGYDAQIPDAFLKTAVREFRKNLEFAVYLEEEIGRFGLDRLCPIEPEPTQDGESHERTTGISRSFLFYINLLKRLIVKDPKAAKQEYLAWRTDEEKVFSRLRIWISGDKHLLSNSEAGRIICNLNNRSFWDRKNQRDLLLVLEKRWNHFSMTVRKRIEKRLIRGRSRWKREKKAEYIESRAWLSLNRIHWLEDHGCRFTFDVETVTVQLSELTPAWQKQYAKKAAASLEGRGGVVRTHTDYSALLTEPLDTLLSKAKELSGRTEDWLVKTDPFRGLVAERPIRAFSALNKSAKRDDYPTWAWKTFLNSDGRKSDKPKFIALIAERLSRLPVAVLAELVLPVADWLQTTSKVIFLNYPQQLGRLWTLIITALRSKAESTITPNEQDVKEPDWVTDAINAPAGKLAEAIMNDPSMDNFKGQLNFPLTWIGRVEELLALKGDSHRHALVIFTFNLNWFFAKDPVWTEQSLLSVLDQEGEDQNAFWAGFFWSHKIPNSKLYKLIRPRLLRLARLKSITRRIHSEVLSNFLLSGWGSIDDETGERFIANTEMRDILLNSNEDFRLQTLWHLKRWSSKEEENGWRTKLTSFFTEVWPRHKKVKSPKISAALCDLTFSDSAIFSEIADIILPLVTPGAQDNLLMHDLQNEKNNIIDQYPEKTLDFLLAFLTENVSAWPYGVKEILESIGRAKPSLLKDRRLIELNRRWNSR